MRLDRRTVAGDGEHWRGTAVDREATVAGIVEPEFTRILKIPDLTFLKD